MDDGHVDSVEEGNVPGIGRVNVHDISLPRLVRGLDIGDVERGDDLQLGGIHILVVSSLKLPHTMPSSENLQSFFWSVRISNKREIEFFIISHGIE